MTVRIDMADDWQVWDNLEDIFFERTSLRVATAPGAPLITAHNQQCPFDPAAAQTRAQTDFIRNVKRRMLTVREMAASGGVYTGKDVVWLIPKANLPGSDFAPKPADVIIDSDQSRWTVLDTGLGKWRETWKLTCRNLALAYELADRVTVERASLSYDDAGVAVKTFPPDGGHKVYERLLARAQLKQKAVVDERGIRGSEERYDVIVEHEVFVTSEDRIVMADGKILDITGYRNARLITELPVIEAVGKV